MEEVRRCGEGEGVEANGLKDLLGEYTCRRVFQSWSWLGQLRSVSDERMVQSKARCSTATQRGTRSSSRMSNLSFPSRNGPRRRASLEESLTERRGMDFGVGGVPGWAVAGIDFGVDCGPVAEDSPMSDPVFLAGEWLLKASANTSEELEAPPGDV